MADAVKTKDIPGHQSVLAVEVIKKQRAAQKAVIEMSLVEKKFADLTVQEKDDLLKALALRFNLIAPD